MGYKCGNCGAEFPNKKEIVAHMIDVHNSPYVVGDEQLTALSQEKINTLDDSNERKADFKKKYADEGLTFKEKQVI